MSWLDRLRDGLRKTRSGLTDSVSRVLSRSQALTQDELDEIEGILLGGDVGAKTATALVQALAERAKKEGLAGDAALAALKEGVRARLTGSERRVVLRGDAEPTVILVAGVNGAGKTTTVAKLAARFQHERPGLPVTFAAADTFRAAAIEQLGAWAERVGADLVRHQIGADPSAVVFDALEHARKKGGVLFIDTAGRLQTKHNLMEELRKIERTVEKRLGRPSDERLLVLDATTGQNGISQAAAFHEAVKLSGLVLTKLDGTAKGGVVLAIWSELGLPIAFIGVGETEEDLHEFSASEFAEALFQT